MIHVRLKGGKSLKVPNGTPLLEVYKRANISSKLLPLGAKIDNKVYDLHKKIEDSCTVEFLYLDSRDGQLIYQRSLSFLLVRAMHDLFPDLTVSINHSLSKGLYCSVLTSRYNSNHDNLVLSTADLERLHSRMRDIVQQDITFIRVDMKKEEAAQFFKRHGQPGKAELLRFQERAKVSVYKCGNVYDHFYGILAPSTGYLKVFDIVPYPPGFIVRFPSVENPHGLPKFMDQKKMFQVFQEYEEWGKLLGIQNVADLNRYIVNGRMREISLTAEALHEKRIAQIADMINENKQARLVLISGPSSSGKTTFSHRLVVQLNVVGKRSYIIHLDDYFVDREHTPKAINGEYDFEAFEALDVKCFQRHIRRLMAGEAVQLPRYNFQKGVSEKGDMVKIDKKTLIIVEGIHGLNALLTPQIPGAMKFKIYVSAFAQLNLDEHNRISTSDVRVLRRLIRDHQYRGYPPRETIKRWNSVRRGEDQHIFPYQENADVMFNSTLIYELSVLRTFSEPWLKEIQRTEEVYSEARRLLKFTSYFLPLCEECVPPTSILREFIGKSCFDELRLTETSD